MNWFLQETYRERFLFSLKAMHEGFSNLANSGFLFGSGRFDGLQRTIPH